MAKKEVVEEIKKGAPEYMNTYGDMMTLLLCFFVLLFSMSNIDARKFEALVVSFSGSLGVLDSGNTLTDENNIIDNGSIDEKASSENMEMTNFKELEKEIEQYLEQNNLSQDVKVYNEDEGLLLRFQDNILFDSGDASLRTRSYTILKYLSGVLNTDKFKDKFISVEGHTDNVPIKNSVYNSNWELSVARACNVVRYLVEQEQINPKRISAAGYSEYRPVENNDTPDNRAKNRRVDIMILKTKYSKSTNSIK